MNISEDEEELLYSSKRSLLSDGKDLWKKKGEKDFSGIKESDRYGLKTKEAPPGEHLF